MASSNSENNFHFKAASQSSIAEIPERRWDVIVAGAGPSGATCARLLAEEGFDVLAIDKERFPRHKVCGDLLLPDAIAMLRRIGLYERVAVIAQHSNSIEVSSPSGVRFAVPGEFLTISRKRLDYQIFRYATEAGVVPALGNVTAVEAAEGGRPALVRVSNQRRPLEARVVVLATGGVADMAHRMGVVARKEPSAIALRCYVRSKHRRPDTIISYDRTILPGYGWVIPLGLDQRGDSLYNVGCGTSYRHTLNGQHNLKKTLRKFMESFEPAREVMCNGEIISPVAGASLRCGIEEEGAICMGNVLGVGETIGTTYPFTGEGIGKAMETGAQAAEVIGKALRSGDPTQLSQFKTLLDTLRPRYEGYAVAERWLGSQWLNDLVARRITRSRYLQGKVQAFMAETDNPRSLFNLRSLLRSWVG